MKPTITTPIWVVIISFLHGSEVEAQRIALWSILPGAALTVLAIGIFRRLFLGPSLILAVLLIALDCMRWIISGLLTFIVSLPYSPVTDTWTGVFALIGLIFPTAYSVIALMIALASRGK